MKIEDIVFWVIIGLIVGVAIWKLVGSPTDTATLISVALFIAGSEILLWKALFEVDKKTAIGFEKIKNNMDNRFIKIDNQLSEIKLLIKK